MTLALPEPLSFRAASTAASLDAWWLPARATPTRSSNSSRVRVWTPASRSSQRKPAQNSASVSAADELTTSWMLAVSGLKPTASPPFGSERLYFQNPSLVTRRAVPRARLAPALRVTKTWALPRSRSSGRARHLVGDWLALRITRRRILKVHLSHPKGTHFSRSLVPSENLGSTPNPLVPKGPYLVDHGLQPFGSPDERF